jgi:hypothetical protein
MPTFFNEDDMTIDFTRPGRMISGSKRGPKGHVCVFNANLCTNKGIKIWFGDIDITADAEDLKRLAADKKCTIYVLREKDARFQNEANPKLENAVAWATSDQVTIDYTAIKPEQ